MEKVEELMQELAKERARSERLKNLLDRANSTAAHCKRLLKDRQEEDKNNEEKEKAKEEEIFKLHRELDAVKYSRDFVEMGMKEEKALETARAFLDGDTERFHDNIATHIEEIKKAEQDKAIQKFLTEHHMEINAGTGETTEYSSAEKIALKYTGRQQIDADLLKNFK